MGLGMVCRLAGNSLWSASQYLGFGFVTPVAPQDVAYAISYSLLVGAMLHLVALTTRRITLVSALDAGAVTLSVGSLAWYFVLGPAAAEAGLGSMREAVAALSQPVCDAALLFLGLVVASFQVGLRFSTFLNGVSYRCSSPTPLTWDFAPSGRTRAVTGQRYCGLLA